ncbi:hypothetical protein AREALGSMS7_03680 [Arenibacter algicola]|uniref:Uncharacterized protein n=1 Tax=Arenibacter algicola TaxID=616991 RepID=A0A221V0F1_9FLAO|nr:hypothetical protein AREALGSMS7_03680 [Arenibacter algicola]
MFAALVRTATFYSQYRRKPKKRFSLNFHKIAHQRYNSPTAIADVVHSTALSLMLTKNIKVSI